MSIVKSQINLSTKITYSDLIDFYYSGPNLNGRYEITDSSYGINSGGLFVDFINGAQLPTSHLVSVFPSTGYIQIIDSVGLSGSFHIEINSVSITDTVTYDASIDDVYNIANKIIYATFDNLDPYSWSLSNDYIFFSSPLNTNPTTYNGFTISIVNESGTNPNISISNLANGRLCMNEAIYLLESDTISLQTDRLNNRSTSYGYVDFPFNNTNFTDNDFSQDGGSYFVNSLIYLQGCSSLGYSSINTFGSNCGIYNVIVENTIYLDLTSLTQSQMVTGKFVGKGLFTDTIYLNDNFNGEINLNAGRSTLAKTFSFINSVSNNQGVVGDDIRVRVGVDVQDSGRDRIIGDNIGTTAAKGDGDRAG